MADAEIEVIRGILASHPRPTDLRERRKRLDALGAQYPLPPDVCVETVDANGVAAEWTTTVTDQRRRIARRHDDDRGAGEHVRGRVHGEGGLVVEGAVAQIGGWIRRDPAKPTPAAELAQ
jgi:hypothetical protein